METLEKTLLRFNNDKVSHYLELEWQSVPTSSEFRNGLNRYISFIRKTSSIGCLSDISNLSALCSIEREWISKFWIPIIIKSGVKKMALIVSSDDLTTKYDYEISIGMANLKTQYFTNRTNAIHWLTSNSN